MGKRKKSSRKPQGPKKRTPLASTFQCLFCNHENSVTVKMEKKAGVGNLSCKICGQTYQAPINYLSAAVDVYADWIDACEDAQKNATASGTAPAIEPHPAYRNLGSSQRRKERDEEDDGGPDADLGEGGGLGYEDDGFVVEDDDAAEGGYGEEED